jgi:hypothetical protein
VPISVLKVSFNINTPDQAIGFLLFVISKTIQFSLIAVRVHFHVKR